MMTVEIFEVFWKIQLKYIKGLIVCVMCKRSMVSFDRRWNISDYRCHDSNHRNAETHLLFSHYQSTLSRTQKFLNCPTNARAQKTWKSCKHSWFQDAMVQRTTHHHQITSTLFDWSTVFVLFLFTRIFHISHYNSWIFPKWPGPPHVH